MAYLDSRQSKRSMPAIIAVTAIEVAVVYAVIQGLAVTFSPRPEAPPLAANQFPTTPPPEPLPEPSPLPKARASDTVITVTDPPFALPRNDGPVVDPLPPQPLPSAGPVPQPTPDVGIEMPRPSPQPSFTPRSARPIGRPGEWATANDYPARDLREGNQGVTQFRLTVGSDGRVQTCEVTRSSGHAGLDEATCKFVARRARFEAASDSTGARTTGVYANAIRWEIPE